MAQAAEEGGDVINERYEKAAILLTSNRDRAGDKRALMGGTLERVYRWSPATA